MGQEIFNSFYSFVMKSNVPLHKLISINTNGAKSKTQYKDCHGHSF
jgi:hypothetical protein